MVDDFHGTAEWAIFMESMQRVFPDRPIVEIPDRIRSSTRSGISTIASRSPVRSHV